MNNLFFLESIFIDQATLNGTRPNSPSGAKPARPLVMNNFNKLNFQGNYVSSLAPHSVADLGPGPRPGPYRDHEGKDVGGVQLGSRGLVSFWTWPALALQVGCLCAR
jgi:hypothetical protein